MNRIIGVISAMLLALAVTEAQQKTFATPNDTTEKTLVANERALYDAVAKADKASFQSLVLPEGVWTTKPGFVPMKLLVDGLDGFQVTKWDIVNPHVTWIDESSAVVLYAWIGTGTFHNQPLASTTLASTVWTKRNGKWVAVHHQETDLMQN
jgi:Domain of unknown function (DUF4440)